MAVAVTQANVPPHLAGLSSGAATGVANLINMQFRKEHRTLYELYQELKKEVGALHQSETVDRLDELVRRLDEAETRVLRIEELSKQLDVTDSKLKILEDRMKEMVRTNEDYRTEVADLKNKMGRLEKQFDDSLRRADRPCGQSEIRDAAEETSPENTTMREVDSSAAAEQTEPIERSNSAPAFNVAVATSLQVEPAQGGINDSATLEVPQEVYHFTSITQDTQPNLPPHPSPLPITQMIQALQNSPPRPTPRPINRKRPVRRAPKIHISQAPGQSNADYFSEGNAYMSQMTRGDKVGFIATFIGGFRDRNNAERLVKQLKKKFPSRTAKDGTVEVLCGWADVEEGMRVAGLIGREVGDGDDEEAGLQAKRRRISSDGEEDEDDEL
ncbi:hypothetical protein CJF30_00002253 [Rutstroemia sp. NJR-2017a BBW]|nr:hypothetical protein CJF30_00002253 [Rutstroemia sp. NJR-2017a BBW]